MKRAGVYFFYDEDGIVDRYVPFFINALHEVVDYVVVVVNGKLTAGGRKRLAEAADDLFVRENRGFDAWAYKEAIKYIGWDELRKFDEFVITNHTIFGPIFPFQQIFSRMDENPCDFWGMYTGYGDKTVKSWGGHPLPNGKPDFIASNFLVFKRSVLHSCEFYQFWNQLPEIKTYFESSIYFEFSMTEKLSDAGFVWATADECRLRHVYQNPTVNGAFYALSELNIPIIRRKAFYDPNGALDYCTDIPRKVMDFIRNYTQYDCNLIWENLLRTVNQYDLKNWFNWNYILPADYSKPIKADTKVAVIFHIYYEDIVEQYLHNIESFPDGTDFYFTTDTPEKQEALEKFLSPLGSRFHIEYRMVENRGRDVSALLVGCRDVVLNGGYDLICFMHDKKDIGSKSQFSCVGKAFSDCCFGNVAASADYVNNVVELFRQQPRLGIAVPPPPKNGEYYIAIGGTWAHPSNFQNVQDLLSEMNINVPVARKKPPVAPYGTVFWFRPEALLPLFEKNWRFADFNSEPTENDGTVSTAIERAYSLIAQGRGYYPAIIMNTDYAEQEVTRMTETVHTYVGLTLQYVGSQKLLQQATTQFVQMLQRNKQSVPSKKPPLPARTTVINLPAKPATMVPKERGPLKSFARGICPIGLWNLFRRMKCAMIGGVYVEPKVARSPFKAFVRACMPRFAWDQLRKAKCRKIGWVFVPED